MVAAAVSWMDGELGGRQGENEPASARVHWRQAEHVPEERTDLLSLGRDHDRVHACDHAVILASAWPATALRRTRCRCVAQSGPQPHLPPFRCTAAERAGSGILRPLVPSRGLNAGEWGVRRGRLRNHYAVRAGLCPVTAHSWAVVKR